MIAQIKHNCKAKKSSNLYLKGAKIPSSLVETLKNSKTQTLMLKLKYMKEGNALKPVNYRKIKIRRRLIYHRKQYLMVTLSSNTIKMRLLISLSNLNSSKPKFIEKASTADL